MDLLEVTIRRIDTRDFDALSRFFDKNNSPGVTKYFHPFPLNRDSAKRVACTVHLDRYYGVFSRDQIIGFCMLRGWDQGFPIPSFGVLVDSDFRGHGVGRKLTEFCLLEASRLGCPSVRLFVYASNEVAVRIYRALDFKEVSREPCDVAGRRDEKLLMTKDLDTLCPSKEY
jgi:[ribosomal protein S18]-alanine N-acetyltransferase